MKWRMTWTVPLIVLAAGPLAAQTEDVINADRPGIADGSTTVGHAVFQVELGAERDDDAHIHTLITPLLLRYGLTKNFELRMETAGYGRVLGFGEDGFNPISAGFKWHFLDEDTKTRRPSLGIIGRLFPKSGSGVFRSDTEGERVRRWRVRRLLTARRRGRGVDPRPRHTARRVDRLACTRCECAERLPGRGHQPAFLSRSSL